MKGTIENPVVIAVIEHDEPYMSNYEVLDWGSNEWLDVQYKNSCCQFEKSDDLNEMMEKALDAFEVGQYARQGYKIRLI